jgi:hypothetical protein
VGVTGRDEGVRAGMAATTEGVECLLDTVESRREERSAGSIAGALLEPLGRGQQCERVVSEPDAGIVHAWQRGRVPIPQPWGPDCNTARSGHPRRAWEA